MSKIEKNKYELSNNSETTKTKKVRKSSFLHKNLLEKSQSYSKMMQEHNKKWRCRGI